MKVTRSGALCRVRDPGVAPAAPALRGLQQVVGAGRRRLQAEGRAARPEAQEQRAGEQGRAQRQRQSGAVQSAHAQQVPGRDRALATVAAVEVGGATDVAGVGTALTSAARSSRRRSGPGNGRSRCKSARPDAQRGRGRARTRPPPSTRPAAPGTRTCSKGQGAGQTRLPILGA